MVYVGPLLQMLMSLAMVAGGGACGYFAYQVPRDPIESKPGGAAILLGLACVGLVVYGLTVFFQVTDDLTKLAREAQKDGDKS